jgi:hypothetical protein
MATCKGSDVEKQFISFVYAWLYLRKVTEMLLREIGTPAEFRSKHPLYNV